MATFFSYQKLQDGGTFILDEATKKAIENDPLQIRGKVVTLTDDYTVGFGSSGKDPLGFVESVEPITNFNVPWVVAVIWNWSQEQIDCAGSETAGAYAACDGKGGIVTSNNPTRARIWGVDKEAKKSTIYIHG